LRKAENGDIDALNIRSMKNSKSLLECPTITALVAALDSKRSMTRNCWNRTWLSGTPNGIINFCRKTNRKYHG